MAEGQYTPAEFAAKIKAQHPQYQNIDDNELVSKVLKKYPEYQSQISNDPKLYSFEEAHPVVKLNSKESAKTQTALNKPAVDGTTVFPKKAEAKKESVANRELTPTEKHFSYDNLYKGLRGITGFIPAAIGAVAKGAQGAYVAEPGERFKGFSDSATAAMNRNIENAEENRGLMGVLGDPLNAAMLIPGPGEAVVGSKIAQGLIKAAGKVGPYLKSAIQYAAVPAVENAALTATSGLVDPTKQFDKGDILTSGALGAGLGVGGRVAQKGAIALFPGINKAVKAELAMNGGKKAKAVKKVEDIIENKLLKKVEGSGTRGSYENLGNKYRESSQDKYDEVFSAVQPESKESDDIYNILFNKTIGESNALPPQQVKNHIKTSLYKQAPELGLTQKEVDNIVDDFMERLADNSAGGGSTNLITPREIQCSKKWLSGDIYNNRASEGAVVKRQGARAIKEGLDKSLDDILENLPNKDAAEQLKNKISKAKQEYKEYKTIDDYLEKYGVNDGSSWRFGHDGIAKYTKTGPMYLPQTTAYRAGGLAQRGLAASILSGLGVTDKKDSTNKKK